MRRTNWFDRNFPPITDNGLLPGILERLEGTPARLRALVDGSTPRVPESGWSAAKELGHLSDMERIWLTRVQDLLHGRAELTAADLTNRTTTEADHDQYPLPVLVDRFSAARSTLVAALRGVAVADLERVARHPRLGTPMRLVDMAFFVAEHDDHHMARLRELLETTRRCP